MNPFKSCPGRLRHPLWFSSHPGSQNVGAPDISLSSAVSDCSSNGFTPKLYCQGSGPPRSRVSRGPRRASHDQKMLVIQHHTKSFHGNAGGLTQAARKSAREPRLWRPCPPTLGHAFPHHAKEQRRFPSSLPRLPRILSRLPAFVSSLWSVNSMCRPHRSGHANRSYASEAYTEPIPGKPNSSGQLAGVGRPRSLAQEGSFTSAPPLGDSITVQRPKGGSKFWSHNSHKSPDGKDLIVHYCKSLKSTEEVARYFLEDQVLGFDLEWKAQASASDSLQNNVSLIQLANKSRIALFQVALFKPARGVEDLVAPSLKKILESPSITKVGVSIKADCTRLRKFLNIKSRAIFELSHLHKLVKYCQSNPRLINKRLVSLNEQVEEHFGLPLEKEESVRCGDWTTALSYPQVQYAATDPYACICLFDALNAKRQILDPIPPLPAHAELDLPIRVVQEVPETIDSNDVQIIGQKEFRQQTAHRISSLRHEHR